MVPFPKMLTRRCHSQSFLCLFSLVLLLAIGVYNFRYRIYRHCSYEIPQKVQKMFGNVQVPLTLPVLGPDHWQPVTVSTDVFVYSAYYEKNFKDRIRIIGTMFTTSLTTKDFYCILWHGDEASTPVLVKVCVITKDRYPKGLAAVYFVCHLAGNSAPTHVSIADTLRVHSPSNVLSVHNQRASSPSFNLTACVSPMFVKPKSITPKHLVEWIETQRILGVELFTVYVHSISDSDLKVLKYYESMGTVEIMNWTLSEETSEKSDRPMVEDIYYFGQVAALNDCLYRNKGRSTYTVAIDLDELIVPHLQQDFTLMEMLNRLPSKSAYSFRHAYFSTETHSDHLKEHGFNVYMIDRFQRDITIKVATDQSKVIYKPDEVVTVGIHKTWAVVKPGEEYVVDPYIAMLHHYRTGAISMFSETDRATEMYLEKVLANMNRTLNAMQIFTN